MTHHTRYPATYMVWNHSTIDANALLPPDVPGGPLLSYGYWITELGAPTDVTGAYFYRRPFKWERRDWPMLDQSEADDERRHPSPALGFGDFPELPFDRDVLVLRELQRVHDVRFGYRRPEAMHLRPDASGLAQVNLLEAQVDEFLSDEVRVLKYAVTEEYCVSCRRRFRLFRLRL